MNAPIKDGGRNIRTTIEKWATSEIRPVIRFLHAKGNPSAEIHLHPTPFIIMMS